MNARFNAGILVLLSAGVWSLQPVLQASSQTSNVEGEIHEMERQRLEALAHRDLRALEGIYDDEYMLVRPSGQVENKEQVLQRVKSSAPVVKAAPEPADGIRFSDIRVRVYGDVAIHTSLEHFPVREGSRLSGRRAWVARVYVKRGSTWRLTHVHETFVDD